MLVMGRALMARPKVMLLDEPFSSLDALTRGTIQDELLKICAETHQTVFMITHDVDEAILLADRILLMTNGPEARIAESVLVDLPHPRERGQIIHDPGYCPIRNHLVDFLVRRSEELSGKAQRDAGTAIPDTGPSSSRASSATSGRSGARELRGHGAPEPVEGKGDSTPELPSPGAPRLTDCRRPVRRSR